MKCASTKRQHEWILGVGENLMRLLYQMHAQSVACLFNLLIAVFELVYFW